MGVIRDETARLASLAACAVMDTPREPVFDNIVFTVAQLFRAPFALLTLVDASRAWAKAAVGPAPRDLARHRSLCNFVIEGQQLLIVEDATTDPRFACQPAVAEELRVRFFAGAPIIGPGNQVIGTLCVSDKHPRSVPDRQQRQLMQLAAQTSHLLRLRVPGEA